jgi:hypothetical protein
MDPGRITIRPHLPPLSKPQATVWALGRRGRVLARSGALSAVSARVAAVTGRPEHPLRPRWRAWDDAAAATRGAQRQALPVETGLAPRWGGIVSGWPGTPRALAVAATTVGARWVGLAVRGGERGGALPVAGGSLPAGQQPAWRGAWRRRGRRRGRVGPRHWPGIGLADRGLAAPWRLRRLVKRGWQPFGRLNTGGTWRPAGTRGCRPRRPGGPQPGPHGQGRGPAWAGTPRRLAGPLLAGGEAG